MYTCICMHMFIHIGGGLPGRPEAANKTKRSGVHGGARHVYVYLRICIIMYTNITCTI